MYKHKNIFSKLVLIIVLSFFNNLVSCDDFTYDLISSQLSINSTKISYLRDDKLVGFIHVAEIPFVDCSVIYDFYIYPQYRGYGYGTKVLLRACDFLEIKGAQVVYIQPGPFEMNNGIMHKNDDFRDENIQRLIKLYRKCGFDFANSISKKSAFLLYQILGICEDPQFLMVKSMK